MVSVVTISLSPAGSFSITSFTGSITAIARGAFFVQIFADAGFQRRHLNGVVATGDADAFAQNSRINRYSRDGWFQ